MGHMCVCATGVTSFLKSSPPFLLHGTFPMAAGSRGAAGLFDTCWSWGHMRRGNAGRD